MFGTRYTPLCAAFIVFGCADIGLDELNNEGLEENQTRQVSPKNGLSFAQGGLGASCAPGCVWSAYAVNLGTQQASHLCGSTECACVGDGNIFKSCSPTQADSTPAPSDDPFDWGNSGQSSSDPNRTPGTRCAPSCVWSTWAVYASIQNQTHYCQDMPCACVVDQNVWIACTPDGNSAPPNLGSPPASQPPAAQPPAAPTGTAAQQILSNHNSRRLTLWDQSFGRYDGADPLSNIKDAAAGRAAKTSCYGTAPCNTVRLKDGLLNAMRDLTAIHGMNYFVTSIAGASHSYGSLHYAGRAVDFDEVNGVLIRGDSPQARALMAACRALGAIEVLGPSNDPYGHRDHVHCAW